MNRRDFLRVVSGTAVVGPLALLVACGPSAPAAPTSAATAAQAQSSKTTGGTLLVGMSAGNVPYPNTPPNEGAEGSRFVGFQIYNALLQLNVGQGDTTPVPGPALATKWAVGCGTPCARCSNRSRWSNEPGTRWLKISRCVYVSRP